MSPRALISVWDKTGLEALARGLTALGWELVSSGGTSRALAEWGIDHTSVETVTGSPEMLKLIARGGGPRRSLLVLGYAGWAPGQLEAEIQRGSWATVTSDGRYFHVTPYTSAPPLDLAALLTMGVS